MEGIQVIKDNSQWRVGSGHHIRVRMNPWLPGSNAYIEIELPDELRNITVSSLLSNDGSWDTDLIRDIFSKRDANLILILPKPLTSKEDTLFWRKDWRGTYSVKRGYYHINEQ